MPNPRMAKLKFPTFSGDLREYARFKELFLHFTKHLNEIESHYQLVESMERQIEKNKIKVCKSIKRAWQILDEAYGDQDRLVEALFCDLEHMTSYGISRGKVDLKAMEKFVERLQNFTSQIESVGMSADLDGRMLLTQVRRKLPEEHRILFLQNVSDGKATDTVPGLVNWLHALLTLLQKAKISIEPQVTGYSKSYVPKHPKSVGVSHSTVSPGDRKDKVSSNAIPLPPKCPLHPMMSSHFLKGCKKFRTLTQTEKFDIMNANGICHRCGHNNYVSGKPPFKQDDCQFIAKCQVPTCGVDTHFASICPRVYGFDGYRHSDRTLLESSHVTSTANATLNATVPEFRPIQKNASAGTLETETAVIKNGISCALPTIMAYLRHGSKKTLVRVLLDTGSQISLLREGIVPKSQGGHMQDFNLTTVGGVKITRKLRVVDCELESFDGSFIRKVRLTEMNKPCGNAPPVTNAQIQQYEHLRDVAIVEAPNNTIDVLLGIENADILTFERQITGPNVNDPVAVKSPLGWYVQGGPTTDDIRANVIINFTQVSAVGDLEDFLGIERMGIEPPRCKCSINEQDLKATQSMQKSVTRLDDGSYQISLPWRKSPTNLPNNYDYAVKRFLNLEKQFSDRPDEWQIYCQQIKDQVKRGVARVVSDTEMQTDIREDRRMWFLPHFAVLKDSETTSVRVVYDGKARYQGHSLNDYLAKGDNLNSNLFEVALRFREYEVGMIADVSKMFQAIKISPEDARFHRYVFRENPEDEIQVFELTTVTFGDKPSPTAATIALRQVASDHAPVNTEVQRVIQNQFYVDDLSESLRSAEDAAQLKGDLITALRKGNFRIRKWLSNSKQICDMDYYPTDGVAVVLGTQWDLKDDTLAVREIKLDDFVPTKRNILRMTSSYYDVFGILSGMLVRPRVLLQKLWMFDLDWDTPISPDSDLHSMLDSIKADLQGVNRVRIRRCLIPERYYNRSPLPKPSLHGASDASEDAMGIGVWLRWSEEENQPAELTYVCSRARLTPLKQQSMPRKELQAILLLSRLMMTIEDALRIEISYKKMWTDSMTVISWLRGQSKSFRSYVACRVGEITDNFDPTKDIAYVPSDQNTIDLVSRGGDAGVMQRVIDGPSFLTQPPNCWPNTPSNVPIDKEDIELKKFHVRNAKVLALQLTKVVQVVDPTQFSNWSRLISVTARILSLKDLQKCQWLKSLTSQIAKNPSLKRMKEAEIYWIQQAQKEINFEDRHVMKLNPFLDEEERVYRVGGRIHNAPLSFDIRHPYLLPKRNHISWLIACERHKHALHRAYLRTAVEIRKNYWIIGYIQLSRRIVREYKVCVRHRGKPQEQRMANLPTFRVKPFTPPFHTTVLDYLGPINVKLNRNTVAKGYCAIFVCAVVRAVHLTCVQDLSTSAFLQAYERFISTRGAPALMISDNATCFRGADNEIRELQLQLDQKALQPCAQRYGTEWKFGPPGGPHHQGLVERMVQEVKKAMKHLVKADKLTFVEWETVFCQISGLLNSRPITASSSSPMDEPPITPNHFLIGRGNLASVQIPCEEYIGNTRKRRELCNSMIDGFWRRWMNSIHKLSPRKKWHDARDNLTKGDIVLVVDENVKRGLWKMAEIVEVYVAEDNFVRVVDVKYADGKVYKRPITKLVVLMKNDERLDV